MSKTMTRLKSLGTGAHLLLVPSPSLFRESEKLRVIGMVQNPTRFLRRKHSPQRNPFYQCDWVTQINKDPTNCPQTYGPEMCKVGKALNQ